MTGWNPPSAWRSVTTIDAHTAGEPLRVIQDGFPEPPGSSIADKRHHAMTHMDELRRVLMWEPRGHADMYGCLLTEPTTSDGDVGVLFMHNEGFSTMCGHGIIGLVAVGMETGRFAATAGRTKIRIDTPAGRVTAFAEPAEGGARLVRFLNVPSFVLAADYRVSVPGLGAIRCDVAYGGAFYAYVDAAPLGFRLQPDEVGGLIDVAARIKQAVTSSLPIAHPDGDASLGFLYGTIFVGRAHQADAHSRNVCVFADGEVDRSPTGTGVSGRLAIHYARGEVALGEEIVVESILGTTFTGKVVEAVAVGGQAAVVPEIGGSAFITGRHEFLVDPADPLQEGFLIR